jgi:hypothetical protein
MILRVDLGNLLAYSRSSRWDATRRELGEPRQRSLELVLLVGDIVPSPLSASGRHCRDHGRQHVAVGQPDRGRLNLATVLAAVPSWGARWPSRART